RARGEMPQAARSVGNRISSAAPRTRRSRARAAASRAATSGQSTTFHSAERYFVLSEEHTSELQSPCNLVCRLLLEKKKKQKNVTKHRVVVVKRLELKIVVDEPSGEQE